MLNQTVLINAKEGFHARPASMFVKMATGFESDINLIYGENKVNGKSIMSILTLGATGGSEIVVEADGADEEGAVEALSKFITEME